MKKIIACISIICYTLLCYSQNQTTTTTTVRKRTFPIFIPAKKTVISWSVASSTSIILLIKRICHPYLVPRRRTGSRRKHFPKEFLEQGYAVIAVNYRLSPRAQNPAYTEDAAEAVAWTFENIEEFGGDKDKIYIAGHSAGGYLCLMLNLDKSYLAKWNIDANSLAGAFPSADRPPPLYHPQRTRAAFRHSDYR